MRLIQMAKTYTFTSFPAVLMNKKQVGLSCLSLQAEN
jgi:hypothetical protein